MYNVAECSDNYAKTRSLWQYCRDEPGYDITDSESCKFKYFQIILVMWVLWM